MHQSQPLYRPGFRFKTTKGAFTCWECSECEGRVERRRPPQACPHCGLAGVMFVPADPALEGGLFAEAEPDVRLH